MKIVQTALDNVTIKLKKRHFFSEYARPFLRRVQNKALCSILKEDESVYIPGSIDGKSLIIQKVHIQSGEYKRALYDGNGHGHSVVISSKTKTGWLLPENGTAIYEFDSESLALGDIISMQERMCGGHGVCSQDGKRLYFVDRTMNPENLESDMCVFDIGERKITRRFKNVGIFAHDVKITADEKKAVVASYGKIVDFYNKGWIKRFPPDIRKLLKPSFCIIDLENNNITVKKVIPEKCSISHVALDSENDIAFFQATRLRGTKGLSREEISSIARERGVPVSKEEKRGRKIFLSGKHFKFDLKTQKMVMLEGERWCRCQSSLFVPQYNKYYATYAVSKKIVAIDAKTFSVKRIINCEEVGLHDPRGLALCHDQQKIIVTDRQNNIFLLDAKTDTFIVRATLKSMNWMNSHIETG